MSHIMSWPPQARAEAAVALLPACAVIAIGRRACYLAGLAGAGSALAAMLVSRYRRRPPTKTKTKTGPRGSSDLAGNAMQPQEVSQHDKQVHDRRP
jgi:hypothetical protein